MREGGREGGREGVREGGKEGGREGGRKEGEVVLPGKSVTSKDLTSVWGKENNTHRPCMHTHTHDLQHR